MYEIREINTPHVPEAKGLGQMIFESFATGSSILCPVPHYLGSKEGKKYNQRQ